MSKRGLVRYVDFLVQAGVMNKPMWLGPMLRCAQAAGGGGSSGQGQAGGRAGGWVAAPRWHLVRLSGGPRTGAQVSAAGAAQAGAEAQADILPRGPAGGGLLC